MTPTFDFIIVGAGAAGCVVASRLANTTNKPSVLLIEAGGSNDTPLHLAASERFNIAFNKELDINWGYTTAPQHRLSGQRIDYSRGKGLGGSTAINFCAFLIGPREDWDGWARLLRDESFNWQNARRHLDKIENLNPTIPQPALSEYVAAQTGAHSDAGLVHLTYGNKWRTDLEDVFIAAKEAGFPLNADINSGDPIGVGLAPLTIKDDLRVSSATSYLRNAPPNLKVVTNACVARVLFDESTATGVVTTDGRKFYASREVVLSAGAVSTPQLLMLSGIGPRDELTKHGIPVREHLPQVGANLQDHPYTPIAVALKRYEKTPPGNPPQAPTPMAFLKSETALSSIEFQALPQATREFLSSETIPSFELIAFTPPGRSSAYESREDAFLFGMRSLLMNGQSRGSVRLRSNDPKEAPVIDPKFLTHSYDCRTHVDGVRQAMHLLTAPVFAERTLDFFGPEDDSDEAIWDYVKSNLHSTWHPSCTARMGYSKGNACVDNHFRVFGVEHLRVIDLSVCVFVPNTHTQSTAYILGEMGVEKMVNELGLNDA